jgi:hypothetical protein
VDSVADDSAAQRAGGESAEEGAEAGVDADHAEAVGAAGNDHVGGAQLTVADVVTERDQVSGQGPESKADGAEVEGPVADAGDGGCWEVEQPALGADQSSLDQRPGVGRVGADEQVDEPADSEARAVVDGAAAEAGDRYQLTGDLEWRIGLLHDPAPRVRRGAGGGCRPRRSGRASVSR